MKADLRDVTICAIDSVNVPLAARAIRISVERCDFADAILFSHAPVEGPFRAVQIDRVSSLADYANFMFKHVPKLVDTPFILVVQWDGYVIDPQAWRPEFRDYDYIGARWPWVRDRMSVGNGGFSLRSRKLLSALTEPQFAAVAGVASDLLVCRTYRPQLERDYGIRYASDSVADQFSYETVAPRDFTKPHPPTFGFHGLGNMWRYTDDAELIDLISNVSPYVYSTVHCANLLVTCFLLGKFQLLAVLYDKMKVGMDADVMFRAIRKTARDEGLAQRCIAACERLTQPTGLPRKLAIRSMQARRAASLGVARTLRRTSWFEL